MSLKGHDVEVWPGFLWKVVRMSQDGVPMLQLDADHLIVRMETCLEVIEDRRRELPNSAQCSNDAIEQ